MAQIVTLLSGGLDSGVLLGDLVDQGHEVHAISFNYGQRHRIELTYAEQLARHFEVEHKIAHLANLSYFLQGSSQTDPMVAVPKGHYEDESMKLTVVPNRNMIMISIATAWAITLRADAVFYAAHGGDHAIYPDCRPEFIAPLSEAIYLADWHHVHLRAPYVKLSKAEIVTRGDTLTTRFGHFPFEKTWSCYEGQAEAHCGECGTCVERIEAFLVAGVYDPTIYKTKKGLQPA